jgi:hypothetical protein
MMFRTEAREPPPDGASRGAWPDGAPLRVGRPPAIRMPAGERHQRPSDTVPAGDGVGRSDRKTGRPPRSAEPTPIGRDRRRRRRTAAGSHPGYTLRGCGFQYQAPTEEGEGLSAEDTAIRTVHAATLDQLAHQKPCDQCPYQIPMIPNGEFPRGVYPEPGRDPAGRGVIIVGQNPGQAATWEVQYYRNAKDIGTALQGDVKAWDTVNRRYHPYYVTIRGILEAIQWHGPIWWTEAVKCQGTVNSRLFNSCVNTFLECEIRALDATSAKPWPIILVGTSWASMAVTALQNVLQGPGQAQRPILAISHPSQWRGAYGNDLRWLIDALGQTPQAARCVRQYLEGDPDILWPAQRNAWVLQGGQRLVPHLHYAVVPLLS